MACGHKTDQEQKPDSPGSRGARGEKHSPPPSTAWQARGVKGALRPVLTRSCSPPVERWGLCGLRLPGWPLTPQERGGVAGVVKAKSPLLKV